MGRALFVGLLIVSSLMYGATLYVVKDETVELYDVSVPLLPVKIASVNMPGVLKVLPGSRYLYILRSASLEILDENLRSVKTVELNRKALDAVLIRDLYVVHDYSITVFDENLNFKASYTLNEKISAVAVYSDMLITLTGGKIVAFDANFKRIWEVAAPDPINNFQIVGSSLMFSTKKEFYIMNISEKVPVLESKHKFILDFKQIFLVRNNLVVLSTDGALLLLSRADMSLLDKVNVSAVSVTNHGDYLYIVTSKGGLTAANVLPSSIKLFQTVANNVKYATVHGIDLMKLTGSMQVQQQTASPVSTVQEKTRTRPLNFLGEVKLPQKVSTSPAIGKELYLSCLDGSLLIVDLSSFRVQSNKVALILTADPVLLDDGSIVLGSWDKSIYVLSDRTKKIPLESNVSIAAARTPQAFVAVDDDGTMYIFESITGDSVNRVRLTGWLVCPPAVHEGYGIFALDWLGILHLVDFSGKEVWWTMTETCKSAEIVLTDELVFVIGEKTVWCVRIKDGKIAWSKTFGASLVQGVSDGKTLYVCDDSGSVYALDLSGNVLWASENLSARTILLTQSGLLAAGDVLYLLSTRDGSKILQEPLSARVSGKMKMSDSGLLVLKTDNSLLLYEVNSSPSQGWPMYLKDWRNSSLLRK
ncbi:outer membrane protein assembly factor BamB family protein [Thermotoga caldifontis]|uniref:outer membrane protein assembly factor BamB family protein n=1 Tax=Thermotoga caldifontis TaxID=1508419 RepID=UPI000596DF00|nr:PQQ-binding-like beta-propeller repeat protein [Thermotoga caldifontis]